MITAHAIPLPAEQRSPYRRQIEIDAATAAELAGWDTHALAFQSSPDESRIPWSEPRVENVMAELIAQGARDIVCHSIGFLVDHVEILFLTSMKS